MKEVLIILRVLGIMAVEGLVLFMLGLDTGMQIGEDKLKQAGRAG
jgi:hypothetical protein